jgi:hypothetical protein
MNRLENWVDRLDAVLIAAANEPFIWGKNDCCLFVDRCVEAITGEKIAADAIGAYNDDKGAYRYLKKRFGTFEKMLNKLFGAKHPLHATRGDIAFIANGERGAIGIVDLTGDNIAFIDHEGLKRLPIRECERFWSI